MGGCNLSASRTTTQSSASARAILPSHPPDQNSPSYASKHMLNNQLTNNATG
jgi:hypothetical protein